MKQQYKFGFRVRPYRSKRLREYGIRMSQDHEGVNFDDNVAAMLKAQGYSWAETPRSIYRVDKLYEALQGYAPGRKRSIIFDDNYDHGFSLAYSIFARPEDVDYLSPLPLSPKTVHDVTTSHTSSAGLTNYGHTKAESEVHALRRAIQTLKGVKAPEPCLAFSRTQFDEKTRLVWGYPYSMTVIEGMFARPLIDWFICHDTSMAFAKTTLHLGMQLRVASYHKEWVYSLDMSQFDAHISANLIGAAFRIIRTWFDLESIEPITGKSNREILERIEAYFAKTPIVMPDLNLYLGKEHGVPSGSYFTQLVDSICNVIIIGALSHAFSLHVSKRELFVLGDDILFFSNRLCDLDSIAEFANQHFCVKMHGSEKSSVTHFDEPVHFLGRVWTEGLPDQDPQEIIARQLFPERFRRYSDDPEECAREVRYLFMAFAAQYRFGGQILADVLGASKTQFRGTRRIMSLIDESCSGHIVDYDHLSGYMRYRMKYVARDESMGKPNFVLQYLR